MRSLLRILARAFGEMWEERSISDIRIFSHVSQRKTLGDMGQPQVIHSRQERTS